MNFKKNGGFTLVELIVVIAIMAILAGVAVPVYSGYIEKANKAADLQLLGAVNSAFGAAVIENGSAPQNLTSASAPISGGKVTSVSASGIDGTALNESFARYFAGNETAEFKVITALYYNKADGVFTDDAESTLNEAQKIVLNYLKETYGGEDGKIEQYLESTFNTEITEAELLGQVDWVTGLASEAMTEGSVLYKIVNDPGYIANMMTSVGLDPTSTADQEKFMGMATDSEGNLKQSFLANSLVLNVAKNTATNPSLGKETLITQLTDGSIKDIIGSNLSTTNTNADPETGLAQAALAYGMYTAYANYIGDETMINNAANMSDLSNLTTMLGDMYGTPPEGKMSFQEYMAEGGQGQADLDGYLSALQMAGDGASKDTSVTLDVLNNGFGGLEGLLASLGK